MNFLKKLAENWWISSLICANTGHVDDFFKRNQSSNHLMFDKYKNQLPLAVLAVEL